MQNPSPTRLALSQSPPRVTNVKAVVSGCVIPLSFSRDLAICGQQTQRQGRFAALPSYLRVHTSWHRVGDQKCSDLLALIATTTVPSGVEQA